MINLKIIFPLESIFHTFPEEHSEPSQTSKIGLKIVIASLYKIGDWYQLFSCSGDWYQLFYCSGDSHQLFYCSGDCYQLFYCSAQKRNSLRPATQASDCFFLSLCVSVNLFQLSVTLNTRTSHLILYEMQQ